MRPGMTSWASQIFSNIVLGIALAPSQTGGDHREEARLAAVGVLEVMRKVGVEGDAVALRQVVGLAVAHQAQPAAGYDRGLAGTGLVDRRGAPAAGGGSGLQDGPRHPRPLAPPAGPDHL